MLADEGGEVFVSGFEEGDREVGFEDAVEAEGGWPGNDLTVDSRFVEMGKAGWDIVEAFVEGEAGAAEGSTGPV